jgi:hypothetical protein
LQFQQATWKIGGKPLNVLDALVDEIKSHGWVVRQDSSTPTNRLAVSADGGARIIRVENGRLIVIGGGKVGGPLNIRGCDLTHPDELDEFLDEAFGVK